MVQGVGFRPTIYRVATQLGLTGYVRNRGEGVEVWVEGEREQLFLPTLLENLPPLAQLAHYTSTSHPNRGYSTFQIQLSAKEGEGASIPPDTALCPDCRRELLDPSNRRYLYPFINCTNCGPRWTITYRLPYDRPNTSMAPFPLCPNCSREYRDPADRRYHAQPISCWECGPTLSLYHRGEPLPGDPILKVGELLEQGEVVAVKGVGGFHLIGVADRPEVVAEIRRRKRRPFKPFGVLFPSWEMLEKYVVPGPRTRELLTSPEAPIVLLPKGEGVELEGVAPGIGKLGVLLPYSPIHLLIARQVERPLILTSCNLSEAPIAVERRQVEQFQLADWVLDYNREIVNRADDSVVEGSGETPIPIRLGRGYTPKLLPSHWEGPVMFGSGANLKGTVALQLPGELLLSPHIGDLESLESEEGYRQVVERFLTLYPVTPEVVVVDKHPHYISRRLGLELGAYWGSEIWEVQHHIAHLGAVLEERGLGDGLYLGVALDGTGFGDDRQIWGGEFFLFTKSGYRRLGRIEPFKLIAGEQGIKKPGFVAVGLLRQLGLLEEWLENAKTPVRERLARLAPVVERLERAPFPVTSSAGRLFDIVAYLLGVVEENWYEGYTGMRLEQLYTPRGGGALRPEWGGPVGEWSPGGVPLQESPSFRRWWREERARLEQLETSRLGELSGKGFQLPLRQLFRQLLTLSPAEGASLFIDSLADGILEVARQVGLPVVVAGGVFQNRPLFDRVTSAPIPVYFCRELPPNDGSISVGQVTIVKGVLSKVGKRE